MSNKTWRKQLCIWLADYKSREDKTELTDGVLVNDLLGLAGSSVSPRYLCIAPFTPGASALP